MEENITTTEEVTVTQTEPEIDYQALLAGVNLEAVKAAGGMAKFIQSQADSRVTQAVQTARTKWEAEQTAAQDEATRLAKMTENEKLKYQLEKDREALEAERRSFHHERLVVETAKQMVADGLPDLAEYIVGKDAETTKANIAAVSGILSAWKQAQVNELMRGKTPQEITPGKTYTKADLKNMTPKEITEAYNNGQIDFTK